MTTPYCSDKNAPPNPPIFRTLEITLVSATDLPGRRLPSLHPRRMKVYAEVSLRDSPATTTKTGDVKIDDDRDPIWNLNLKVDLKVDLPDHHPTSSQDSQLLIVKLYRKRSVGPTSDVGRAEICVNTLHQKWLQSTQNVESCDVKVIPNGKLNISYSFH